MNKTKTGRVLSAAAIANLAVVGFVAAPVNAATHSGASGTENTVTPKVVPSAGKAHPGLVLMPGGRLAGAALAGSVQAGSLSAKPRGFIPSVRDGVKPDTASTCNGDVCIKVWGAGLDVYAVQAHFFDQASVCRDGKWISTKLSMYSPTSTCFYSHQQTAWVYSDDPGETFLSGTSICAEFNHVAGKACIHLG
jgi:hypothetical protein